MSSTTRTRRPHLAPSASAAPLLLAAENGLLPRGSHGLTDATENERAALEATAADLQRVRVGGLPLIVSALMAPKGLLVLLFSLPLVVALPLLAGEAVRDASSAAAKTRRVGACA